MAHAEVDPGGERVRVVSTWAEKELVNRVSGSHAVRADGEVIPPGHQLWSLPLTWGTCVTLRGVFGDRLDVGPRLQDWAWERRRAVVDPALRIRGLTEWPALDDLPDGDPRLYPFQRVGTYFVRQHGDVLLGDDLGVGKTVQVLTALRVLGSEGLPALVVSPNSVKKHWERLAGTWLPEATPYLVTGTALRRRKVLDAARVDPRALVLVNYEAVRRLSRLAPYGSIALKKCRECSPHGDPGLKASLCETHRKELNDFGFKTVVYDEVHHLGDPKSKQTRACWAVGHDPSVRRRWGTSGTLFDRPEALWSLLHTVAPDEFPTRTEWMDRYMLWSWNAYGGQEVVGFNPEHRAELFSFLDPHFRRMPKALVLPQLPPKVRQVRTASLTPAQRRMYDELEEGLITTTPAGETWVVPSVLALRTRLLQLASATVEVEDKPDPDDPSTWVVRLREPAPKLDVLEEVVGELHPDERFVVCAPHRQLIELALLRLRAAGVTCGLITGEVSEADRQRALDDLRAGDVRCVLFVTGAGGEGLDMSAASTLVRIQRSYSMRTERQAEDRVHRIGSEHHDLVRIVDVVAESTREEDQVEVLHAKLAWLEEVNRDRARLLAGGYGERSPEVLALEQLVARETAEDDLWELAGSGER